ncbi:hypothetical protein KP509_17G035100 [Ceratopteris richardii]|nr:hypothetical protein KP509_17G035100 [Ceratopteris richardii]
MDCAEQKDLERGLEIHVEIARLHLLEMDFYIGSTLINMYGKCGSLLNAQEVFDSLKLRNIVAWNSLISNFVQNGFGKRALAFLDRMQGEGMNADAFTLTTCVKACASIKDIPKGCEIHAEISRKGFSTSLFVGNTLIDMYVKFGMLENAHEVFQMLLIRNVVTWTALITGYAQYECGEKALKCFEQMICEGIPPNGATYASMLKACCSIGAIRNGIQMHVDIAHRNLLITDVCIGSSLVDMYTKCGLQSEARRVFDMLQKKNVVTWTALISGYVKHEQNEDALDCFEQMQAENVAPNVVTFLCCLKACGNVGALFLGNEIHAEIARIGLSKGNLALDTALVCMYVKCGLLAKAQEVFDRLPFRDDVSWSALIASYADQECGEAALYCFEQMQMEGIFLDPVTIACSLKACTNIRAIRKGQEIHAKYIEDRVEAAGLAVSSALIDFHCKCSSLSSAQEVFDMLTQKDVVSWNALMGGYMQHDRAEDVLSCYTDMQLDGVIPDAVTFVYALKACGMLMAIDKGTLIHTEVEKNGLLTTELAVGNAVVDMYGKCGFLDKAKEVFDILLMKNVVTWNALVGGFSQYERDEEALKLFEDMQLHGVIPNAVTYTCALKACGNLGAGDKGSEIHREITKQRLLLTDPFVGSALVDMYAKCGLLSKGKEVFDALPVLNTITWNALITGYSQCGEVDTVLFCVDRMVESELEPDSVTLMNIINSCSHAGLVEVSLACFQFMHEYAVDHTVGQYTSMIDLLGRAGQLEGALLMLWKGPFHPNVITWLVLLSGCRKWGNLELGKYAFDQALFLDEKYAAAYIGMYNLYADADMQGDAATFKTTEICHECASSLLM